MKRIWILALTLVLASAPAGWCGSDSLKTTKAAELPSEAARLVKQSKTADRDATTVGVIQTVAQANPAAMPAVVGAIARSAPAVAALAAGTAASQLPDQAVAIAKAATAAAPAKAGQIAESVCKAVPAQYRGVVLAVAQAAPKAGKQVLAGLGQAIPQLAAAVEQAIGNYRGIETLPSVLDQINNAAQPIQTASATPGTTTAQGPRGPSIIPPYIPLTGNPGSSSPGTSGEVPPGGRDYSAP